MTEEEIKTLQEAKEAAEVKAAEAESLASSAREEVEKAKLNVSKLVEELTEERKKKQEALAKVNLSNGELDIVSIIEQTFQTREEQKLKSEFTQALEEFKNSKSEFQSDESGIVFAKFENGLKKFNLSEVKSKEQMKASLEEAYRFLNFKSVNEESEEYSGTPSGPASVGQHKEQSIIKIKPVLEQSGMNEEKFLSLKRKYPEALEGLGIN